MYRFDIMVLGQISESLSCDNKDTAIKYILKFRQADNFGFKFYINDEQIPYNKINEVMGITSKMILDSYTLQKKIKYQNVRS